MIKIKQMKTKAEVYEGAIKVYKKNGQGLSAIVKLGQDQFIGGHLYDLVEEGYLKISSSGSSSIGHPESTNWYMPVTGYNVWEDENSRKALQFLRLYLGLLPAEKSSKIDVTPDMILHDVKHTKEYLEWLERNYEQLELMKNMSTIYPGEETKLTEDQEKIIKDKKSYAENCTVSEIINILSEQEYNVRQILQALSKMKRLYSSNQTRYEKELKNTEDEINSYKKEKEDIKRSIFWLQMKDKNSKIKDLVP
jgi:hypothetical protein